LVWPRPAKLYWRDIFQPVEFRDYYKTLGVAKTATADEIKKAFRKLARQHHPDLGGDLETMKALNASYHQALKGQHGVETDGRRYSYRSDTEQELMDVIAELMKLPELAIDLIGLWVWIRGNTKPVKDSIKALGARWHSDRGCWYYKPKGFSSRGGGGSLDELAAKYGVQAFRSKASGPRQLAA